MGNLRGKLASSYTRDTLASWVDDRRDKVLRTLDRTSPVVIIAGLAITAVQTAAELSPVWVLALAVAGRTVDALFVADYILRIVFAPSRRGYVSSGLGLIDLVAVVGCLLGSVARDFRVLRLLRVLSTMKMMRAGAVTRFFGALRSRRDEWVIFTATTVLLLYVAATGIYIFEHEVQPDAFGSVPASAWWAVTTLTTVGYGDTYPITPWGRFFTAIVLLIGLGIVGVPAGIVSAALAQTVRRGDDPHA